MKITIELEENIQEEIKNAIIHQIEKTTTRAADFFDINIKMKFEEDNE